jgi:hypothetical protein
VTAGRSNPPDCTAFAGTGVPGRCLSICIPLVAAKPTLETSTCSAGQKCVPCNDPITGAATGACGTIGCDEPAPAAPFKFPSCCGSAGTCVPRSQLGASASSLAARDCPNPSAYLCAPADRVVGRSTPCHVSFSVIPPFSWNSACVPDCVIGDNATFIPRGGCPDNWSCPPP